MYENHRSKLGGNSVLDVKPGIWGSLSCPVCGEVSIGESAYVCGFSASGTDIKSYCKVWPCSCKIGTLQKFGCICDDREDVSGWPVSNQTKSLFWEMGIAKVDHLIEYTADDLVKEGLTWTSLLLLRNMLGLLGKKLKGD